MRTFTQDHKKHSLLYSISKVSLGAALAQLIVALTTPVVARLYGPEAFGSLGVVLALSAFLVPLSTVGLSHAIVLARKRSEAVSLVQLCISLSTIFSLVLLLSALVCGTWLLELVKLGQEKEYSLAIPFLILLTSLSQILVQWYVREKEYGSLAGYEVLNSAMVSTSRLLGGVLYPGPLILIYVTLAGMCVALVGFGSRVRSVFCKLRRSEQRHLKFHSELICKYREFPLYRLPQSLISAASHGLPMLLLASIYGVESAGQYSLAFLVLSFPGKIIGTAVFSVIYSDIASRVNDGRGSQKLIVRATIILLLIGALPFGCFAFVGAELFVLLFGSQWEVSGQFAQLLSFWMLMQFANRPAVAAFAPYGMQAWLLVFEMMSVLVKVASLWAGFYLYQNASMSILFFSISGGVLYSVMILKICLFSEDIAKVGSYTKNQKVGQ